MQKLLLPKCLRHLAKLTGMLLRTIVIWPLLLLTLAGHGFWHPSEIFLSRRRKASHSTLVNYSKALRQLRKLGICPLRQLSESMTKTTTPFCVSMQVVGQFGSYWIDCRCSHLKRRGHCSVVPSAKRPHFAQLVLCRSKLNGTARANGFQLCCWWCTG